MKQLFQKLFSRTALRSENRNREESEENYTPAIRNGLVALAAVFLLGALAVHYYNGSRDEEIAVATTSQTRDYSASQKALPIYCVDTEENKISLSFDAAWGNEDTEKILKILKKNGVHATFFMTGGWIESYPDDVKAIAEAGHDLGNHSENHKQMSQLSKEDCKTEIMTPHEKVKELTGKDMTLFRPPYGDYNDTLIEAVNECNYHAIQWDVDSLDWKDYGVDSIIRTVCEHKHLGKGSIILCHNGAKYTAQALDTMIKTLKEKGFEIVPISELIYTDNYEMDVEGRQHLTSAAR